jgi:hypothetical protein
MFEACRPHDGPSETVAAQPGDDPNETLPAFARPTNARLCCRLMTY